MGTNRQAGKGGCSASGGSSSRQAAPSCAFWGETPPVAGWVGADGQDEPQDRGAWGRVVPHRLQCGSILAKAGGGGNEWERLVFLRNSKFFKQGKKEKKEATVAVVSVSGNDSLVSVLTSERKINPIGLQPA